MTKCTLFNVYLLLIYSYICVKCKPKYVPICKTYSFLGYTQNLKFVENSNLCITKYFLGNQNDWEYVFWKKCLPTTCTPNWSHVEPPLIAPLQTLCILLASQIII